MYESIAHLMQVNGICKRQTVNKHCRRAAEHAAASAAGAGLGNTAYLAGLLHDMGKCKREFDSYITSAFQGNNPKRGSANHTFAGVIFLFERYHSGEHYANVTSEILAYAVASHHGLMDGVNPEPISGYAHRLNKNRDEICYDESLRNFLEQCAGLDEIDALFRKSMDEVKIFFDEARAYIGSQNAIGKSCKSPTLYFFLGMAARVVLSAVIDGDRRDTAEFIQDEKHEFLNGDKQFWQSRADFFEEKYKRDILDSAADTPINHVRRGISDKARTFASCPDGIYRMTVKTGAGKTLSSLRFSLNCAAIHEKHRIFFIIPLLSILEQNAAGIRSYIGCDDAVLEHHSNVVREEENDSCDEPDSYEMLAESWDSPVILTTLVQLANALFSGKATAVRRMRSLCGSVIAIDEIQSLPRKMTYMFNLALDYLAHFCGCTIVLSSATQPCFEGMDYPMILAENPDIVEETAEMRTVFARTEIVDKSSGYDMDTDELADFAMEIINDCSSLLVICNTKRNALEIYERLALLGNDKFRLYHLSTNMCMQHRRDALENITNDLVARDGCRVVCVSTQLVEAGVNFSFESCIRVKAGLDNIAQAAGRCNRSFEFSRLCKVYVVSLKDENLTRLPDIAASQAAYNEFAAEYGSDVQKYGDIFSAESAALFYRRLISSADIRRTFAYPTRDSHVNMLEMLSDNHTYVKGCRESKTTLLNQAFNTAGREFCVFEDNTADVIVPYSDEAEAIICELLADRTKFDMHYFQELLKRAKPYTVSLFENQIQNNRHIFYSDKDKRFIAVHKEYYDKNTGVCEKGSAAEALCL